MENVAWHELKNLENKLAMTATILRCPDITSFSHVIYDRVQGVGSKYTVTIKAPLCRCWAVSTMFNILRRDTQVQCLSFVLDDGSKKERVFFAGCYSSITDTIPLYCIQICHIYPLESRKMYSCDIGIVLTPINLSENLFRRVGLLKNSSDAIRTDTVFKDFKTVADSIVHIL